MKFVIFAILLFILVLICEIFFSMRGKKLPSKNPSHSPVMFGETGETLTYLVLGDSTTAGVGGDYKSGIL